MSWLDIVLIFIVINMTFKGYSLGLTLSVFNLVQMILSFTITRAYFYKFYSYIISNEAIYAGIKRISFFIFNIIFSNKLKKDPLYVSNLLNSGLLNLIIIILSILIIYKISNICMELLFSVFSFLLDIKFLKKLDRLGGIILGFIKGIIFIYILVKIGNIVSSMPGFNLPEFFEKSYILRKINESKFLLGEGDIYEKTRFIICNIINTCGGIIGTFSI